MTRINSEYGRFFALIDYEDHPFDPRKEYDHDTTIVYHSPRYVLGDVAIDPYDFELPDNVWAFPVYAYIHSGITLSMGNDLYNDWDPCQSGIIYISKDVCPDKARAFRVCEADIEEFSAWLEGDVWGFDIYRIGDDEPYDSCGGFYNYDNCEKAAKEMLAEYETEPRQLSLPGMEKEIPIWEGGSVCAL